MQALQNALLTQSDTSFSCARQTANLRFANRENRMDQSLDLSLEHVRLSVAGMVAAHGRDAERICRAQIEKMRRRKDVAGERLWRTVLEQLASSR